MFLGRALITGGAGLIGSHVADQLVERAVTEFIVLDNFLRGRRENLATALSKKPITLVEGDIRDRNARYIQRVGCRRQSGSQKSCGSVFRIRLRDG